MHRLEGEWGARKSLRGVLRLSRNGNLLGLHSTSSSCFSCWRVHAHPWTCTPVDVHTHSTSGGVQLSGTQPENKRQQLGPEPWLSLRQLQLQLCGRTEAGAKRQPPPTHEKISLD